ncbi:MAG: hypothetical protein JSU70_07275 [Phycisphaerales bacterium]|nr:MAG: hypothetical protein JSU70_07275 [Phycisphaerales bacterium]
MSQFRENKQMQLTSRSAAMVLLRTSLPARVTRTCGLGIVVGWGKEAAP